MTSDRVRALQPLCASGALLDGGDAVLFKVVEYGRVVPAFALRHAGQPRAYLNRCAHVPAEMDWQPGKFWDAEGRFIVCSVHGALYDPPDGVCVSGPCRGARLLRIELHELGGLVHWCPTERFQPVNPEPESPA
jgi:nitrite reductase/ring-hydroxylating ferredoxin subunit